MGKTNIENIFNNSYRKKQAKINKLTKFTLILQNPINKTKAQKFLGLARERAAIILKIGFLRDPTICIHRHDLQRANLDMKKCIMPKWCSANGNLLISDLTIDACQTQNINNNSSLMNINEISKNSAF